MVVGNAFSKEMSIRKRIANIYNKREENFPSLREYNDYLEEVEDMIFNLIEGIDVPAIEARIAQYQRENAEQIMIAQARKALGQDPQAGSSAGLQGHYAPAIAGGIAQPRPTQPLPVGSIPDMLGGEYEDDEKMKLRTERAAKAGGWSLEISRKRALEEAFGSLWV
ncbi:unnamed protein product [Withania somnifera]